MDIPDRIETAVIGAGPAGSTVAAALARRGRDVALLERDTFPRDKVCGEFLSHESLDGLEQLGCLNEFLAHDPPTMDRARLTVPSGDRLEVELPARARGLSRRRLDSFLFDRADRAGARCFDGADVRKIAPTGSGTRRLRIRPTGNGGEQTLEADAVVASWGRRTGLDRRLDRPFFQKRSPYVAFKRHHRLRPGVEAADLEGVVELHVFDGGYCGISFVEDGIVNVCAMFERRLLQREEVDGSNFWQFLRKGDSPLAARLRKLEPRPETRNCTVAQIPLQTKRAGSDGDVMYVGDAAGMIAPLAGDGQAMAIESGLKLAALLDDHLPEVPADRWRRIWEGEYAPRLRLGRWLQKAMIRPAVASVAIRVLDRVPAVGRALARWTRG